MFMKKLKKTTIKKNFINDVLQNKAYNKQNHILICRQMHIEFSSCFFAFARFLQCIVNAIAFLRRHDKYAFINASRALNEMMFIYSAIFDLH